VKIALVLQTLGKGGAERVASLLSQAFAQAGHEVHVLLWERVIHYPYAGQLTLLNTPATPSLLGKLVNLVKRAWLLRRWYQQEKPDLVISLMETANIPVALARIPAVISVHLDPRFELASYQRWLMRWLYPLSHLRARVAVSHGIAQVLTEQFHIPNWQVIANPVDLADIAIQQQADRLPACLPPDQDYLLGIGRLHPQKGFDLLIRGYAQSPLCRQKPLVILGEGEGRASLEALVAELDLADWVHLPGWSDNPFPWFAKAWAFVMSSRSEGLGNTLIEAMACGCACIAADCDFGPRDILTHEQNGLLVATESATALSDALTRLWQDPELYQRLQVFGKHRAADFEVSKIAQAWLALVTTPPSLSASLPSESGADQSRQKGHHC
jgi:glycosyltransferase involved in cell wall biosynthesis